MITHVSGHGMHVSFTDLDLLYVKVHETFYSWYKLRKRVCSKKFLDAQNVELSNVYFMCAHLMNNVHI